MCRMNSAQFNRRAGAFTMVEMLVVISIIALLLAMLLPVLAASKQRARRVVCESHLRQIGLGFQSFAHDHNSKFPMQVSSGDGGSLEFVQSGNLAKGTFYFAFRHFQTLAATLQTPAILVCPADTRLAATNFAALQNSNVSYFVGVTADYSQPMSVLAGDGNLASSSTLVQANAGGRLTWTRAVHQFKGNVLFADGHVEEWSDLGASRLGGRNDLVLPSVGARERPAGRSANAAANVSSGNEHSAKSTNNPADKSLSQTNRLPGQPSHTTMRGSPQSVGGNGASAGSAPAFETPGEVASNTPATTNAPGSGGSVRLADDDPTMSPFDRQMARFLRDVIVGAYLLILLLLLLFAGYRLWCHHNDPERMRRRRTTSGR